MTSQIFQATNREEIKAIIKENDFSSDLKIKIGELNGEDVFVDYQTDWYNDEESMPINFISYIAVENPECTKAYDNEGDMSFITGDSDLDTHLEALRDYFEESHIDFLRRLNLSSLDVFCLDLEYVMYFDIEEVKKAAQNILDEISEIKVIDADRIMNAPPTMTGPIESTFYYEEHQMYAIEVGGHYHQISQFDSIKEIKEESEHWLSYANEEESFFTNYAEDGQIFDSNFKRSVSDIMLAYVYFKELES